MTPQELKAWCENVWDSPGITQKSHRNRFVMMDDAPAIVPGSPVNLSATFGLSKDALKRRRKLATYHPKLRETILAEAKVTFPYGPDGYPLYDFGYTPRLGKGPFKWR